MSDLKTLKDLMRPTALANGLVLEKVDADDSKQEAIKWIKILLKISKMKIIKMPEIELTEKGIEILYGEFEGDGFSYDPPLKKNEDKIVIRKLEISNELYSALVLCKMYDITEEDLK